MKILILGASGLVGSYIYKYFSEIEGYNVVGTYCNNPDKNLIYVNKLDIQLIRENIGRFRPDIIIDTAYLTDVDRCETDTECRKVNIEGTKNTIMCAKEAVVLYVFISSDYVFSGENGPYQEEDKTHPINEYGKQKLECEKIIQQELAEFLIIRVATVYGFKNGSRNPLQRLKDKEENKIKVIRYVEDQWTTPTYVEDIPKGIEILIHTNSRGVWHISSGQFLSRYELAKRLVKKYNIGIEVEKAKTYELSDIARRPIYSGLKIDKMKRLGFMPVVL